jgi:hypothetical protein
MLALNIVAKEVLINFHDRPVNRLLESIFGALV